LISDGRKTFVNVRETDGKSRTVFLNLLTIIEDEVAEVSLKQKILDAVDNLNDPEERNELKKIVDELFEAIYK